MTAVVARATPGAAWDGAWTVREHVYDDRGHLLGTVRQRREVKGGLGMGDRRVVQDNLVDDALAEHPLAGFGGHHEFALVREGRRRRYLGPSVVGSALELDDGVMVSRGLWPALGWSFTGWSIVTGPERQLTGGSFRRGGGAIATIVGVAAPEGAEPPSLAGPAVAIEVASVWTGRCRRVGPDGSPFSDEPVTRVHEGDGWTDRSAGEQLILAGAPDALAATARCEGTAWVGAGRRVGPTVELELWAGPALSMTVLEVLDPATAHLTCIRWRHRDGQLVSLDVLRLRPQGAPP